MSIGSSLPETSLGAASTLTPSATGPLDSATKESLGRLAHLIRDQRKREDDDIAAQQKEEKKQQKRRFPGADKVMEARPADTESSNETESEPTASESIERPVETTEQWLEAKVHPLDGAIRARGHAAYRKQARQQVLDDVEIALMNADPEASVQEFIVKRVA